MPRGKDQKTISKRIDLHYWKKAHPLRSARRALVLMCFVAAAAWMAYAYATRDQSLYNPGHVTSAHATIEHNCAQCHAPDSSQPGQFMKAVSDNACMKCHEAPLHAPTQLVREGNNADNPLALAAWMKQNGMTGPSESAESSEAPADSAEPAEGEAAEGGATPGDATSAEATGQPADAHHGGMLVSAQCAACHVEHRGREALAAISDNHCTQCHSDLTKAVASGVTPKVQPRVVAFNKSDHPAFGRRLEKDAKGNWIDPTKLSFNHKVHLVDQGLKDCSMCHTTWQPNLARTRAGHDESMPPFAVEGDRPLAWAAASDGRYMQPVNYEQHCQQCHPVKAAGVKGSFTHDRIEIVRDQVRAAMQASAMERYTAGDPAAAEEPSTSRRRTRGRRDSGPVEEGDWLRGELEQLNKNIANVQKACSKCHEMKDQPADMASAPPAKYRPSIRPETLKFADLSGELNVFTGGNVARPLGLWQGEGAVQFVQRRPKRPGGAAPEASEESAADSATPDEVAKPKAKPRKAIDPPELQTTELTGIPAAPRRWFVASRFDHRSHRDMACVECHAKLDSVEKFEGVNDEALKATLIAGASETKELLSPGMEWQVRSFAAVSEGVWSVSTSMKACTDCHRADAKSQRFTTDACVTCHAYHDHSRELFPDGRPEPRVKATPRERD